MFNSKRWEDRFGAIQTSVLLVRYFYPARVEGKDFSPEDAESNAARPVDSALCDFVWNHIRIERIPELLVDEEYRVRNAVGPLLREMILKDRVKGGQHFETLMERLLDNIEATFSRDDGADASGDLPQLKKDPDEIAEAVERFGKKIHVDESGKTMHDTEGWKSLETTMRILQNVIEAMGVRLYAYNLDRVIACVVKGVAHINRFVREISHFVIVAVFVTSKDVLAADDSLEETFRTLCD